MVTSVTDRMVISLASSLTWLLDEALMESAMAVAKAFLASSPNEAALAPTSDVDTVTLICVCRANVGLDVGLLVGWAEGCAEGRLLGCEDGRIVGWLKG